MTHYDLLGVRPDATAIELREAWRRLARQSHPDVGGDAQTFKAAATAYEVLSDPVLRAAYDREALGRPVLTPSTLDFGSLAVGGRVTRTVRVTNGGAGEPELGIDRERGTGWRMVSASGSTRTGAHVDIVIEVDPSALAGRRVSERVGVSMGPVTAWLTIAFSVAAPASSGQRARASGAPPPRPAPAPPPPSWTPPPPAWTAPGWTPPAPAPDRLPGWNRVIDEPRWRLLVASAAGPVGIAAVLVGWAKAPTTAGVLVGGLLAIVVAVVLFRLSAFDEARLRSAAGPDQAAGLAVTGVGAVALVVGAIIVVLAVIIAVIVVVVVFGVLMALGSKD